LQIATARSCLTVAALCVRKPPCYSIDSSK
jgi:hypothetical protein